MEQIIIVIARQKLASSRAIRQRVIHIHVRLHVSMAIANENPDHTTSIGGRSRLVEDKYYDDEATSPATSPTIRSLVRTAWESALKAKTDDEGRLIITKASKDAFKSRCIGVLDVTMDDQTHQYVIACSSTGLTDLVVGTEADFAKSWDGCMQRIEEITAHDEIKPIIAPVRPSTQCYCSVPSTTAVSEFCEDQKKAYWHEIENRIKNRRGVLRNLFQIPQDKDECICKLSDAQFMKLQKHLSDSVYWAKFVVDILPVEDFQVIVDWHRDLIEKPLKDTIQSTVITGQQSPKETMHAFCVDNADFFSYFGYSQEKIKKLLEAATDPCPIDMQEVCKRVETLGLRYLNEEMNNNVLRKEGRFNNSTMDQILQVCHNACRKPKHSRLADYFAQCCEDNATIALMEYLEKNPNKNVISVDWYSTVWCIESSKIQIKHKPLCGVCNIRFKDRLEWLLEHRVSVIIIYLIRRG